MSRAVLTIGGGHEITDTSAYHSRIPPKRKDPVSRYTYVASAYDAVSAEWVYGVGRRRAIPALHLAEGSSVLDVGCGTGLNFPLLIDAVGRSGKVVGIDRSRAMLEAARRKMNRQPPGDVVLVEVDAEKLTSTALAGAGGPDHSFDAVLFTYSLSLMSDWEEAWRRASDLVRPGGRAAIVDMGLPRGRARVFAPAARLACLMGDSDISAHPWSALENTATDVQSWSLRGGYVQVRVGTL